MHFMRNTTNLPALLIFCASAGFLHAADIIEPAASFPPMQVVESNPEYIGVTMEIPREAFEYSESPEAAEAIPGFATITQPGMPEVPFISRNLLVPPTAGVRLGEVRSEQTVSRLPRSTVTGFPADQAINTTLEADADGFWPPECVVLGKPAIMRGYRIVTVTIFPEQVNLNTGEVRRNEKIDFKLEFDGEVVNPVVNPERSKPSVYVDRMIRSLVDNPPPVRDNELSGTYLYIIPDVEAAIEEMQPLLEWRRRQGHKVSVVIVNNNAQQNTITPIIRDAYNADPPVEFVTLVGDAARGDINIPAYSQQGDWGYALQEGDDALADLAIGRLSCRTSGELETIVHKLVTYESDPFDGNEEWFLHGGVVAGSSINGMSEVFVAKYVRRELYRLGFTEVRGYFWPDNGNANGEQQFLTEWFRWGISVLHYRAFHLMNGLEPQVIDNLPFMEGRWPAVLAISCETGNFTGGTDGHTEHFLRARGGGVGAIGTATPNTNVKYNNIVAGGVWKGIYKDSLYAFGWGLNAGKFELWRAYSGFDNNFLTHMEWNNLMGDAGTHLWTGLPSRIEVDHSVGLALGQSYFDVEVSDAETNDPVASALVCLYKGDEVHEIEYTDANGIARFSLDPEAITEGEMLVTVTKHNVRPYLGSVETLRRDLFAAVTGWSVEEDRLFSPGDTVNVFFTISNSGAEDIEESLVALVSSGSEWLSTDNDEFQIADNLPAGETVEFNHEFVVASNTPDRMPMLINVLISSDGLTWRSSIRPVSAAPYLEIDAHDIENGSINPGDTRNISLRIGNYGSIPSEGFTATLISRDRDLTVLQNTAGYEGIDVDGSDWEASQPFRISTNNNIVPGRQFTLELQITFDDETVTTATTTLTVGRPGLRDPFGPDAYGYLCFDSYDTSWAMSPEFDWIEIDPNAGNGDFAGDRLNIIDTGDNQDESVAVPLPFEFRYYGQAFDTLTICTNGWAAFGDWSDLADFRNTHIGQALGPSAQLCVWWDNLMTPQGSGIYTYHDEEGGRFIVEWNRMARLLENDREGASETFQLILYSQNALPTPSTDGVITFQYLEVTNQNQPAHNDIPFCTIGIGNLQDTGGLEYTYWNRYPEGAREIRSRMAISFTPTIQVLSGVARGRVTDLETGRGISGITVRSNKRGLAVTDSSGNYLLDLAIGAGYALTAQGIGWNERTEGDIVIEQDDTVTVNFALTHPNFRVSGEMVSTTLDAGQSISFPMMIHNSGNGPLNWNAEKSVEGEDQRVGQRRFYFPAAQRSRDTGLVGVAQAGDRFYVSGSNYGRTPMIYVFDERGALLDSFPQPGVLLGPMPDLAWDGQNLWGAGGRNVYCFDVEGRIVTQFIGPFAENVGIAWDPVRELLWISGSQHNQGIYGFNRQGGAFVTLSTRGFRIKGLGFWSEDPDEYPLYVLHQMTDEENNPLSYIHKYSLSGRSDTMFVTEVVSDEPERPGGLEVSTDFAVYDWSLVMLKDDITNNHGGDRVDVYQLGIVTTWLGLRPEAGFVAAEDSIGFVIDLNTAGLDTGTVNGEVTISHNAGAEAHVIPVTLTVRGLDAPPETALLPTTSNLLGAYPSPFNATVRIEYQLSRPGHADLRLIDLQGRVVATHTQNYQAAGRHGVTFDATNLPSGLYTVTLRSAQGSSTRKVVCIK